MVNVSTRCPVRVRATRCSSRHVRSRSSVGQSFMTLSLRFHDASSLYSYQRGRDASVGGSGPTPCRLSFGVRKCSHRTIVIDKKKEPIYRAHSRFIGHNKHQRKTQTQDPVGARAVLHGKQT